MKITLKPQMENPNRFINLSNSKLRLENKKISMVFSFTSVLTSNRVALNLAVQHDQYRVCCAPQMEGKSNVAILLIIT